MRKPGESEALQSRLDKALGLLREIEWCWDVEREYSSCPCCWTRKENGHVPSCQLAELIGREK